MQKSTKIDACRINCFFASSFLVCDGHWSKKLEVKNKLIRRLSNKLLFRIEFSRAHEPDHRVFSCSQARSSSFLVLASQIIEFSCARKPDCRVFSCSRARSSSFLVLTGQIWRPAGQQASQQARLSRLVEFFRPNAPEDKIVEFFHQVSYRLAPKGSLSTRRPKVFKS